MATHTHYARIARALVNLTAEETRGCWKTAAQQANLPPLYFRRVFKRYTGVSPRQYAASAALADIKMRLANGESVLSAALAAGLSGGGRAHDLFVAFDGMTPGEFARRGEDVAIEYGLADSVYGGVFAAATKRGVCLLHFADDIDSPLSVLRRYWPGAIVRRNDKRAQRLAAAIFANAQSPLHVSGTNFQINVWQALLALPVGAVVSYRDLARVVTGNAAYTRAVASAVAANPVAVLIPCHRVLAADGGLAGYAWGVQKKRVLLAHEFANSGEAA